jgi:hypothetical protein
VSEVLKLEWHQDLDRIATGLGDPLLAPSPVNVRSSDPVFVEYSSRHAKTLPKRRRLFRHRKTRWVARLLQAILLCNPRNRARDRSADDKHKMLDHRGHPFEKGPHLEADYVPDWPCLK